MWFPFTIMVSFSFHYTSSDGVNRSLTSPIMSPQFLTMLSQGLYNSYLRNHCCSLTFIVLSSSQASPVQSHFPQLAPAYWVRHAILLSTFLCSVHSLSLPHLSKAINLATPYFHVGIGSH